MGSAGLGAPQTSSGLGSLASGIPSQSQSRLWSLPSGHKFAFDIVPDCWADSCSWYLSMFGSEYFSADVVFSTACSPEKRFCPWE